MDRHTLSVFFDKIAAWSLEQGAARKLIKSIKSQGVELYRHANVKPQFATTADRSRNIVMVRKGDSSPINTLFHEAGHHSDMIGKKVNPDFSPLMNKSDAFRAVSEEFSADSRARKLLKSFGGTDKSIANYNRYARTENHPSYFQNVSRLTQR